ncbi:sugar phosphate isomerase/epimerase family protein [Propionispira raffinosivorans]|uniref:sugar phosphate isomerase/epimerase family protein n=1 Tax=Propionispira raffinosivorans TaxID=86959 RepID=UPI00037C9B80|nr:TIM barrel protein [Propionispira raffinosivorans]
MKLALSNLSFAGFEYPNLKKLPISMGLEIFYEFGSDDYWNEVLTDLYPSGSSEGFSIHAPCISINLADIEKQNYLAIYKNLFIFAQKWQADYVVVHTNESLAGEKYTLQNLVKERLLKILDLAALYNVPILIENVGLYNKKTLLYDQQDFFDLIIDLNANVLLDIGHATVNDWSLPELIQSLDSRLKAFHLHDNHGIIDEHLPIGQGTVDWQSIFTNIKASVPTAIMVFEYAHVTMEQALHNIDIVKTKWLDAEQTATKPLIF